MTVLWLPCFNLEDSYEISSDGELRSIDRYVVRSDTGTHVFHKGQPILFELDKLGYRRAKLSYKGTTVCVKLHRLVAQTFIPNPENKPQVNHIDGNKANNNVGNLEWVTNSENQSHATRTGLKITKTGAESSRFSGTILAISPTGLTVELEGNLDMKNKGFDFRLVSACLLGKRKTHRGFTFKRKEN